MAQKKLPALAALAAVLLAAPGFAADGPQADIALESNNFRAIITIDQTGGGCSSGYSWQNAYGCVHNQTDYQHRDCTPTPTANYVANSGSQYRTRTLVQHQNTSRGSTVTGRSASNSSRTYPNIVSTGGYGSYGSCTGGTLKPADPPPTGGGGGSTPAPGTSFPVPGHLTAMICASGDTGYSEGGTLLQASYRNQLIS